MSHIRLRYTRTYYSKRFIKSFVDELLRIDVQVFTIDMVTFFQQKQKTEKIVRKIKSACCFLCLCGYVVMCFSLL